MNGNTISDPISIAAPTTASMPSPRSSQVYLATIVAAAQPAPASIATAPRTSTVSLLDRICALIIRTPRSPSIRTSDLFSEALFKQFVSSNTGLKITQRLFRNSRGPQERDACNNSKVSQTGNCSRLHIPEGEQRNGPQPK